MNYQEFDPDYPWISFEEQHDSGMACAQIDRDKEQALMDAAFDASTALMQFRLGNAEPVPF